MSTPVSFELHCRDHRQDLGVVVQTSSAHLCHEYLVNWRMSHPSTRDDCTVRLYITDEASWSSSVIDDPVEMLYALENWMQQQAGHGWGV